VALVYLLAMRIDGRRLVAGAAAAVLACEAWLLRWSATGMESSFAMLMALVCLLAGLTASRSAGRSALFGALLFLAYLARPETGLIVPAAFIAFALSERQVPLKRRFLWLVVFAALTAIWFVLIRAHTGTFLPLTAGAKQGRPVLGADMLRSALVPLKVIGATVLLPALAAGVFAVSALVRRGNMFEVREGASKGGLLLVVMWAFLLPAVYVIFDFHVLSRYLLPVIPAIVAVGTAGTARLAGGTSVGADRGSGGTAGGAAGRSGGKTGRMRTAVLAVSAVSIVQSLVFFNTVVVGPTVEFSRGLDDVLVPMGEYLSENTPPGSVVASPDIGAIGYFSGREVLDLGGLVTPEINDMRREIDVERIIDEGLYLELGADYLVDRHTVPRRFDGRVIKGFRFTALRDGVVSNLGIRKPDPVTYVLYRIDRVGESGTGESGKGETGKTGESVGTEETGGTGEAGGRKEGR
jgi:hypothetical protein